MHLSIGHKGRNIINIFGVGHLSPDKTQGQFQINVSMPVMIHM